MLNTFFARKPRKSISLFLGTNKLAICILEEDSVRLLAQADNVVNSQWGNQFSAWVEQYKLQKSQVSVVLSRDFYQTFDIEKPKVDESEIMTSLPFLIKDLVTESIFDLVVDYYDRPLVQHKGEQITAVCITKQRVIEIRDMVLKHGMMLNEIIIEEQALIRLLGNSEDVNMLLSQQNTELVVTVVKEGRLFFSHRLRGFSELLALPFNDVEDALVDGLSLELQRVLDYISSQLRLTSISHIYLAFLYSDIDLLAEKLGFYLAKTVLPFGEKDQYDFTNLLAYGALMEGASQ